MSADLTIGAIPQFYREVYDIVCPNQEQVDRDLFIQLLLKSSLPKTTIIQIWDSVDTKQGYLSRNGLYKALALTALAQQGKVINEKLLDSFSGQELPRPSLGDLSDLRSYSAKIRRTKNPNVLSFTFGELCNLDSIKVELVPEKKGLILKHVEYEITSQRCKATVLRRYTDFVALHDLLLARFPYRLIPRLPPKKLMGANREFIDGRKKSLRRYLNLVVRHPMLNEEKMVKYFLTFSGSDVQHKIKENFKGVPDEFMTNEMALKAKDFIPMDTQQQVANSKQHMNMLYSAVTKLREMAERMVARSIGFATDLQQFGRELSGLSADESPVSSWATGSSTSWEQLQKGFKHLAIDFAFLSDKGTQQAAEEDDSVVERLAIFQDLLSSYKDLIERHEKGVLNDHQKALQKMGQYKKKHMSATVQGTTECGGMEQLEHRILEQEGQIMNMENRNYFSLYCLQMETQLIHANLEILADMLHSLVDVELRANTELARVWETIQPIIDNIFPREGKGSAMASPPPSPRLSPLNSPSSPRPSGGKFFL